MDPQSRECKGLGNEPCPLGIQVKDNRKHKDDWYCPMHLPVQSEHKLPADQLLERWSRLLTNGKINLSRVQLPGAIYTADKQGLKLVGATFVGDAEIRISANTDLSHAQFLGRATVVLQRVGPKVGLRNLRCGADLELYGAPSILPGDFTGSSFFGEAKFWQIKFPDLLIFDDCTFAEPPRFDEKSEIPQQTTFRRAKFLPSASRAPNEGAFRDLRNRFHAQRNRELEGRFYMHEKRCHRDSLTWKGDLVAKGLSWSYDQLSRYGQRYERALGWFALLQVVAGLWYGCASDRLGCCSLDLPMVAFTLAQVAKPFELLPPDNQGERGATIKWFSDLGEGERHHRQI